MLLLLLLLLPVVGRLLVALAVQLMEVTKVVEVVCPVSRLPPHIHKSRAR